MAKIVFDIVDESGEKSRVFAGQADLIEMERKYDVSVSQLQNSARMEWIAFVAYSATKRAGKTSASFDEWIADAEFETVDQGNA